MSGTLTQNTKAVKGSRNQNRMARLNLFGRRMATGRRKSSLKEYLILYSTNTWIAYRIAERYYGSEHYVWCTPFFDPRQNGRDAATPPTSSPFEMYQSLYEEVKRGDRHSAKIGENRLGIVKGASAKRRAGIINANQEKEINAIVKLAEIRDFRPLLYIIPFAGIAARLREPPPQDKAHPLSAEYVIDPLPRRYFDVIEFGGHL